jgi:hypothetical protein
VVTSLSGEKIMRVSTAVKVAIRQYFGGVRGFEQQVYDLLMDLDSEIDMLDVDFSGINPDIYVWEPVETFTVERLLICVDALINDVIAETIGE